MRYGASVLFPRGEKKQSRRRHGRPGYAKYTSSTVGATPTLRNAKVNLPAEFREIR
jgi:hypothetical protein